MPPPHPPGLRELIAEAVLFLAIAGCAAAWARIATRRSRGLPVLPYQRRRFVPWQGVDLAFIFVLYLALQGCIFMVIRAALGAKALRPSAMHDPDKVDMSHSIAKLMESGGPLTLLLCVVSAVLVAPIVEEFFFRVMLLGWLDKVERRNRRRLPTLRRFMPHGLWPILFSSFLFAMMHFRAGPLEIKMKVLAWLLLGDGAAKLLTMAFAISWLRWRVGATAADFGWAPAKLLADVRLGLIGFVMMTVPIYGLQLVFGQVIPKYIAPDPFPLFFLAIMLGLLYYRTHRIAPSVTLHAALNATSFFLLWVWR
jgi:membrane protease YdiL (CAAX protease family)